MSTTMANLAKYHELCKKKTDIEDTIKELTSLLESQKGVGLTEDLVDAEGYPRSDIDVYSCRHARHQIACLQNDHLDVMSEIEELIHEIHSEARTHKDSSENVAPMEISQVTITDTSQTSFAIVDRVDLGSPSSQAGLQVNDRLVEFGSLNKTNFSLRVLADVVKHSLNKALNVVVLRNGQQVKLTLTPSRWNGQGVLGCNIKPLPAS